MMNILFLKQNYTKSGLHIDLVNALVKSGHQVFMIVGNSDIKKNIFIQEDGIGILHIKTKNIFSSNLLKKGIAILKIQRLFIRGIKKSFDIPIINGIVYATPPITFAKVIKYCKKRYDASTYLTLKDIFPQNSVDIGMLSKKGIKGLIYKFFRLKEKSLYKYSDKIGCMSKANMEYLLKNNNIDMNKVEYFPNSIIIKPYQPFHGREILNGLGIDDEKIVFIFGGNLGKPQGIDFLIKGIKACERLVDAHFVIIGKGSEKERVDKSLEGCKNVTILDHMPQEEYLKLSKECDIGLILLDKRFTIPNYPSRTLAYMENAMPIFACTDKATDIKELIEDQAKCGKWIYSDNPKDFAEGCKWFIENRDILKELGMNGRKYMEDNFDVAKHIYKIERIVENK